MFHEKEIQDTFPASGNGHAPVYVRNSGAGRRHFAESGEKSGNGRWTKDNHQNTCKNDLQKQQSKVAAVNSNGKVTAKAKGNATVTAKTSKVTWTYKIKVEKPKLNNTRLSVYTKTSKQLKLKGTSRKVTWSSSAPSVVSVNKKGKITARRTGKATITAKVNGVKYKCKVTVKARSKKSSGSSWLILRKVFRTSLLVRCQRLRTDSGLTGSKYHQQRFLQWNAQSAPGKHQSGNKHGVQRM